MRLQCCGDALFVIRRDAVLQTAYTFADDIVADNVMAEFGEPDRARHSDVSSPDYAEAAWFDAHVGSCALRHVSESLSYRCPM